MFTLEPHLCLYVDFPNVILGSILLLPSPYLWGVTPIELRQMNLRKNTFYHLHYGVNAVMNFHDCVIIDTVLLRCYFLFTFW